MSFIFYYEKDYFADEIYKRFGLIRCSICLGYFKREPAQEYRYDPLAIDGWEHLDCQHRREEQIEDGKFTRQAKRLPPKKLSLFEKIKSYFA